VVEVVQHTAERSAKTLEVVSTAPSRMTGSKEEYTMRLERAIEIAVMAHTGQTDKAGAPYILHPLRVMLKQTSEETMIAAVLHDVVEDSVWSLDGLRAEGFSEAVLEALNCLTKRDGESYEDFIERVKPNPLARRVKRADLEDNMDISRIPEPTERDRERLKRYHQARQVLVDAECGN
jgi:(p)ppGpp synthase/HD superfamily hydrolase